MPFCWFYHEVAQLCKTFVKQLGGTFHSSIAFGYVLRYVVTFHA